MKTQQKIIFACAIKALTLSVIFTATACSGCGQNVNQAVMDDVVRRDDYTSVYQKIGANVTLDDVEEGENGTAYLTKDGVKYQLGMDFLSMAMVYNATPTSKFPTFTAAYNEWWRLFMQRWNLLAPEVPLYSNQYYDVYNGKIAKLQTSPYWGVTDAIVGATLTQGNSVILGSHTELSGAFRNAAFGKSSAGAADLAIQTLTSGYSTVVTDLGGSYAWADNKILRSHTDEINPDGTRTFTLQIADDLTFSDGSPIRAENYLVATLVGSSKPMREAGGGDAAGITLQGYEAFNAYEGEGEPVPFTGVRLLDDYTFSVTVKPEYANYYYAMSYGAFTPTPMPLYAASYTVKDDGQGAYLEKDFYKKTEQSGIPTYAMSDVIKRNVANYSAADFPYSGPYILEAYTPATRVATLKRNPYYKGDHRGTPTIERISYVKIISETQFDQLKKGQVDVLSGVTGGEETRAALALVDGVNFKETHYDRAGYGKLAFRCDFGPTQFAEVRRAVMYTIDRDEFAQTFTGGYGTVVHAPYHAGSEAYLATKDNLKLNRYAYSVQRAKEELRAGGWTYNDKGEPYDEAQGGVRYKRLQGYEKTYENLTFASVDNRYKTKKIDGEYYMPLVINWIGTQPNLVTDQLITAWQNNPNASENIGAYITYSSGDMNTALYGEYCQMPSYGFTRAKYGAVNFATGFTGAAYDQAFAWTIDPSKYDNYSVNYLRDEADFYANYSKTDGAGMR